MILLPKPPRRGPKPRTRLKRGPAPRRRSRPRRQRRGETAELVRTADALFSKLIRQRDTVCRRCMTHWTTDTMHVFSRDHDSVRCDPDNALGGCRRCHTYLGSAKFGKPSRMEDFYVERFGRDQFEALKAKAATHGRVTADTLLALRIFEWGLWLWGRDVQ